MERGDRVDCWLWHDGPEEDRFVRGTLLNQTRLTVSGEAVWAVRWDCEVADTTEYEHDLNLVSAVELLGEIVGNTEL